MLGPFRRDSEAFLRSSMDTPTSHVLLHSCDRILKLGCLLWILQGTRLHNDRALVFPRVEISFVISLAHSFGWFSAHATDCLRKPILTIADVYTGSK